MLAAKFLEEFAGNGPWAHADIAGPAFLERSRGDLPRGGTGYGVRLIVRAGRSAERVNLNLTPEHELVRTTVRDFAEPKVAPDAAGSTASITSRTTWSPRWPTSGSSAWRCPRSTAPSRLSFAIAIEELARID